VKVEHKWRPIQTEIRREIEVIMKANTLNTRLNQLVTDLSESLGFQKSSRNTPTGKERLKSIRNRPQRKDFAYYMQIMDAETREIVGHLADISSGGFKIDTQKPMPVNQDVRFLMNLPGEVASKSYMVFSARSRWCQVDPLNPCAYNVGYQLTGIFPEDLEIINRMIEKYGRDYEKRNVDLRRSYKW
jgi:hypothetical protein